MKSLPAFVIRDQVIVLLVYVFEDHVQFVLYGVTDHEGISHLVKKVVSINELEVLNV